MVLAVAGVYRLPAQVGAGLDPDMVRCFAAVTIRSFIARLACALTHPAGTAVPADRVRSERPAGETAQSHRGAAATWPPPELTISGPGTCKPPVPPAAPSPPRRQGGRPNVPGAWDLGRWRALPRWDGLTVRESPGGDAE
jgi:hypothetical protein